MSAETMDRTVGHVDGDDAAAGALVVHDQVDGEILDVELCRLAQRLAVHGVKHRMAGTVGGSAGAPRLALAELRRHAAKSALEDLAVLGAGEGHAPMLQLVDGFWRVTAEILDAVLVAEPVRPLHGVVHMPAPIVGPHVTQRRGDAALGRHGVRAGRKDLGDAGGAKARLAGADHGAQSRSARADNDDVIGVVGDLVSTAAHSDGVVWRSVLRHGVSASETDFQNGEGRGDPDQRGKEGREHE